MKATPLPRAELEEAARRKYRERFHLDEQEAPRGHRPRNLTSLLVALDHERPRIEFRGRVYELRPISFVDGLRLLRAWAAMGEHSEPTLTGDAMNTLLDAYAVLRVMTKRYLLPTTRVRRLLWSCGWRPNPANAATEKEVGELLGFFLQCREISRIRRCQT